MRILPVSRRRLRQGGIAHIRVVHAGAVKVKSLKPTNFVAIPVLPVHAATLGEDAEEVADLEQLKPEAIWTAPAEWCPNPAKTVSLRVKGNSMSPLILDGYIIAVDMSDVPRDELLGQIVVAWNAREKKLLVSRLIRFDHTDALISDQREYQTISLSPRISVAHYGPRPVVDRKAPLTTATTLALNRPQSISTFPFKQERKDYLLIFRFSLQ
jgi:SOS-response transcriptional repressor LexA